MVDLSANLAQIRERITAAAIRAGRDPNSITIVAVTKSRSPEKVLAAWQAGLGEFGENRVEEAAGKIRQVESLLNQLPQTGPDGLRPKWHMIGHVQSRKASQVVDLFTAVHSVDSLRLAQRLSRLATEAGKSLSVLLEVNVSGEVAKYGFDLARWPDDPAIWHSFLAQVEEIVLLPGLRVEGLMTVAPVGGPEVARPVFRKLGQVRAVLVDRFSLAGWQHLSMGMSDDYEAAIEEGATIIRLGRALFGA